MADKLVVAEEKYRYRIQWEVDDGDDLGAYLCQDEMDGKGEVPLDRDEWEHWTASRVARTTNGFFTDDLGAYWESEKQARTALRVIKEALKQERSLPDWAQKALEAGWKPPKGWKA